MVYTKQQWRDGAAGVTPINAARLAVIEQGISDAHDLAAPAAVLQALAGGKVNQDAIGTAAVGADEIATGAVGTAEIAAGAVTKDKVATGTIGIQVRAAFTAAQGDPAATPATAAATFDAAGVAVGDLYIVMPA